MAPLSVGVVGGGLCGMAVSAFLRRSACAVTVYDGGSSPALGFSRTASAVAGGLLHPLTPSLKLAWEGEAALHEADALVAAAEAAAGENVVATDVVLRPAADAADAEKLRRAAAASPWLEWLDAGAFAEAAGRPRSLGGARYVGGKVVDPKAYLAALAALAAAPGGGAFARVAGDVADPRAILSAHDAVVVAGGAEAFAARRGDLFPERAGLTLTRGESVVVGGAGRAALLQGTYLCPGRGGDAVLGATHDHVRDGDDVARAFAEPRAAEDLVAGGLAGAAAALLPPGAPLLGATAGVRLNGPRTHRGRLPVAGRREPGLWVAGALGARGLLRHAQLGRAVADAVLHDDPGRIPPALRLDFE